MAINRIDTSGGGDFGQPPDAGDHPSGHTPLEAGRHTDGTEVSALASALSSLRDLQRDDPARFRMVMAKVVAALRSEAATVGGTQAPPLGQLADRFEQAAHAGSLPLAWLPFEGSPQGEHHPHGVQAYSARSDWDPGSSTTQRSPVDLARVIEAALR
jgi:hypothetical protein